MMGNTSRIIRKGVVTLMAIISSHCSSEVSASVVHGFTPALLTRMSMRPNSFLAAASTVFTPLVVVISPGTARPLPPASAISSIVPLSVPPVPAEESSLRAVPTMAAPRLARASAMKRPMPRLAPVTTATL